MTPVEPQVSPIHLVRSFFPEVVIRSNPGFGERSADQQVILGINTEFKISDAPNKPNSIVGQLVIQANWDDGDIAPYPEILVTHVGIFEYQNGMSEDILSFHRNVSVPAMLYSSVREYVRSLTQSGPWGPVLLPALLFPNSNGEPQGSDLGNSSTSTQEEGSELAPDS